MYTAAGRSTPFGTHTLVMTPCAAMKGPCNAPMVVTHTQSMFAEIAAVLANHEISIEGVIQRARSETEAVPVVMTTHETTEAAIQKVLAAFAQLNAVRESPHMIRIENF